MCSILAPCGHAGRDIGLCIFTAQTLYAADLTQVSDDLRAVHYYAK